MNFVRRAWGRIGRPWRILLIIAFWLGTLAFAYATGLYAERIKARVLRSTQRSRLVPTNLYNVRLEIVPVPGEGRDGGVAAFEDGLIYASGRGRMWFVDRQHQLHQLELTVPINVDEFMADPFNENTVLADRFAVKDIFVQELGDSVRVLATHNQWQREGSCHAMRVSMTELTRQQLRSGGAGATWRTIYETTPCRPLTEHPDGIHRNPPIGAGGRIAALTRDQFLLTVGGFGPESGPQSRIALGRTPYGKSILIDLAADTATIFTSGHRNPQGLVVGSNGLIWSTEHAARGGDELNLLRPGADYGYPTVSYGTSYETQIWPTNPRQGHHDGFERPRYAWVPSIGVSQLLTVESDSAFPSWQGDLLVSSLGGGTVYRMHYEDEGDVVIAEPIEIGRRIRDIAEQRDGTVVLKTDDNVLIFMRPVEITPGLSAVERGAIYATTCMGCHTVGGDGGVGLAPSLTGVVGRDIASLGGFEYSPALSALEGEWTRERLHAFIANPDSAVPGTFMRLYEPIPSIQIDDIITYLESL
jgi:cytochrome c2